MYINVVVFFCNETKKKLSTVYNQISILSIQVVCDFVDKQMLEIEEQAVNCEGSNLQCNFLTMHQK